MTSGTFASVFGMTVRALTRGFWRKGGARGTSGYGACASAPSWLAESLRFGVRPVLAPRWNLQSRLRVRICRPFLCAEETLTEHYLQLTPDILATPANGSQLESAGVIWAFPHASAP